ncbi:MAG: hypothetical protein H0X13_15630 [Ramlibacter sp.]|nr:hypothetical protein [Ramlibacter sp.]
MSPITACIADQAEIAREIRAIDASPAGRAALAARIAAAAEDSRVRRESIAAAQRVYSKYKLHSVPEILRALQNLESSIELPQNDWINARITALACDIEDSMQPQDEPELSAFYGPREERQYDSQTPRSWRGA